MEAEISNFEFQIFNFKCAAVITVLLVFLVVLMAASPAPAQNATSPSAADSVQSPETPVPAASARPPWRIRSTPEEGELIELDDVQIHGEIAQPNVQITVSRAEPQFRMITLEHVAPEGLTDLDLSGLRGPIPPAQRIKTWREILDRPRQ